MNIKPNVFPYIVHKSSFLFYVMVDLIKMQNFADHILTFLLIAVAEKCSIFWFQPRKYLKHLDQNQGELMVAFLPEAFLHVVWAWLKPVKFTTTLSYKFAFSQDLWLFASSKNLHCQLWFLVLWAKGWYFPIMPAWGITFQIFISREPISSLCANLQK